LSVAGDERVEEMLGRALFGVVTEGKPEGDGDNENDRDACENQRTGFVGNYRGRIEK
jgi:hypothetical protein